MKSISKRGIACLHRALASMMLLWTLQAQAQTTSTIDISACLTQDLQQLQVAAIEQLIAPEDGSDFYMLQTGAQGNFRWWYENGNGIFNAGTYSFLSGTVATSGTQGLATLGLTSTFPNAWSQIISGIYFSLSSADVLRMNQATQAGTIQGLQVVSIYEGIFGKISTQTLDSVQAIYGKELIAGKLDYIVSIVVGAVWSGMQALGLAPYTWNQMSSIPDLLDSLPAMPVAGEPVVAAIQSYIALVEPAYHLQDSLSEGCWTISQLRAHTQSPSAMDGGILTFDPSTGQVGTAYQVGYGLAPSITEIYSGLQDSSRKLQIWIDFTRADSAWVIASLCNFPLAGDSSSISFGMPDTCGANSGLRSAKYVYAGYESCMSLIDSWNATAGEGWFAPAVAAEAWTIDTQDLTGYKFAGDLPAYSPATPDDGGSASWLTGILLCTQMESDLVFDAGEDSSDSSSTVVLHSQSTSSQSGATIPLYESNALVIGGWIGSFSTIEQGNVK